MKNDYNKFHSLIERYPAFLLDAYGVFWRGNAIGLLPGAKELMRLMVQKGKVVGILSNTTQVARTEITKFCKHELLQNSHFHFVTTSGEVTKNILQQQKLPFPTQRKSYYVFGDPHPLFPKALDLFTNTGYHEVSSIEDADFIYLSIPHIEGKDVVDPERFEDRVRSIIPHNLPMLCANPDRYAHEGNPPQAVVRQGSVAALYEKFGGKMYYIGKPYPEVYKEAFSNFSQFGITFSKDILMIGDTPETDIRGANHVGMHSALLTETGIFAERLLKKESSLHSLEERDSPNYFVGRFCL